MAGVRINHPTERGVTFTIVDRNRPYRAPLMCPPPCARMHEFKTYHIRLDGGGFAIVSPLVWERLQRIPTQPFALANEVKDPPTLYVGAGRPMDLPRIVSHQE